MLNSAVAKGLVASEFKANGLQSIRACIFLCNLWDRVYELFELRRTERILTLGSEIIKESLGEIPS